MADWFGKGCEYQCNQWEHGSYTDSNYQEYEPVLIFCDHVDNPEDTEGNCRKKICPQQKGGLENVK